MMPKTSPKLSLKNGPSTPCGRVWRMSPTLLRTSCQTSGTRSGGKVSCKVDVDRDDPRPGDRAHGVKAGRFLQPPLQPVGQLVLRLLHRGAGPDGGDEHGLDREARVFVTAKVDEGEGPGDHADQHHVDGQLPGLQRPFRKVRADHEPAPSRRTGWPGRSACTPAVTTMSPGAKPVRHDDRRRG